MEDIILIGGGGHCKSVIDSIRSIKQYNIVGVLDLEKRVGEYVLGVKIVGTDDQMEYYFYCGVKNAFITIGSIGIISLRKKLYKIAKNIGYKFPNIIDCMAIVSKKIEIGEGNFIGKGSIINAGSVIKDNCIINSGAIIEHDVTIEEFCHIAPGAVISGNTSIGYNSHIGINATITNDIRIGNNTMIGAGSVVVNSIGNNKKAYGSPCREVGEWQKFL